ncbi:MAG: class I SAM-dependent methyltransferase [Longimicrobiaceae bacterium]
MDVEYERGSCPACGAREREVVAGPDEVRRELESLWEFHLRRVEPGTPVRHLADRTVFSQDPPIALAGCRACGTVYRDPRERGDAVAALYAEEELDPAALRDGFAMLRRSFRRQLGRLNRFAGPMGTGLEVGSHTGAFLAAARDGGWRFEGLDVNEDAVGFARAQGLAAARGTLEDAPRGRAYDAVAIWNCFEQLPDPRCAARTARSLLRPGGVLALRVPDGGFYAAVRRRLDGPAAPLARGVLAWNNLLAFPYRAGFTRRGLRHLLEEAGFSVLATVGDVLIPISGETTRRWAAWEERALKRLLRTAAPAGAAPWFEIYARAEPGAERAPARGVSPDPAPRQRAAAGGRARQGA